MAKVVTMRVFDASSIASAYKKLQEEEQQFKKKCDEFTRRVAEEGARVARVAYGGAGQSVAVTVEPKNKGYTIIASGEAVCFIEFGAGTLTTTTHDFMYNMPFNVAPGSWSDSAEGAHTYSAWIEAGQPDAYRYDSVPRPGMLEAYKAITARVRQIAKEVFA